MMCETENFVILPIPTTRAGGTEQFRRPQDLYYASGTNATLLVLIFFLLRVTRVVQA